ncbi:MAG: hypothetical protein HN904_10925, partial [Victivallales bacterium]|nr:hypothetical protein [Victivallales bacterium]
GHIHLDQKLFGLGKSHATVVKLRSVLGGKSLYARVLNSFQLLLSGSQEIPDRQLVANHELDRT